MFKTPQRPAHTPAHERDATFELGSICQSDPELGVHGSVIAVARARHTRICERRNAERAGRGEEDAICPRGRAHLARHVEVLGALGINTKKR